MIDEKKLIEDLSHNVAMDFTVNLNGYDPIPLRNCFQEFADKMKQGFINLINAQPKQNEWKYTRDELPGMFVSVLMYVLGDHPLPTVHEGYLTGEDIWISLYGEAYTMDEVPRWKPMPEPPKDGEGQ